VVDPAFTRDAVEAFVADPGTIGSDFLGRYVVFATSGPPEFRRWSSRTRVRSR
jgi:hypothetical protein